MGKEIGELIGLIFVGIIWVVKSFYDLVYWIFESLFKMIRKGSVKEKVSDNVEKYRLGLQLNKENGYVGINNPFRGILIVGGAGSGKSESMIKPLLWEAMGNNYCGIVYDFKDPELSLEASSAFDAYKKQNNSKVKFHRLSFTDINTSDRCNPLAPKYIPTLSHAEEYATAIINNLMPESISKPDFWNRSAVALLQAGIWFMREEKPEYCTLPHVVNFLQSPIKDIIEVLKKNKTCSKLISSMITAYEQSAQGQLAGTIGTLQLALNKINTPEIAYLLGKDEINLDINNKENPVLLTIGNNPSIQDSLSPVISLVITVCLKMMNAPNKHHSIVVLDEAPTIYIPKLETVPATARSNKISVVFCCQDFSQVVDNYGVQKKDTLVANLANQFYGRVNHMETSNYMIKLAGRQEIWQESYSTNRQSLFKSTKSTSVSLREKDNLKIQDIQGFSPGDFLTILVERENQNGNKAQPLAGLFLGHYKGADPKRAVYEYFEANEQTPNVNAAQAEVQGQIDNMILFFSGEKAPVTEISKEIKSLLESEM